MKPTVTRSLALTRLQRKLERAELEHLRRHVAELADKLAEAEARIERAEIRAQNAEITADMWHDQVWDMQQALDRDTSQARAIGLTPSGALLIVDTSGVERHA